MVILALERDLPGASHGAMQPHLTGEAARVWELYQAGVLRALYFRQVRPAAVLILEASDAAEASRILETLPLVGAGLTAFDIIPLIPYPGLARLFTP